MTFFVIRYRTKILFKGEWKRFCQLVNGLVELKDFIFEVT